MWVKIVLMFALLAFFLAMIYLLSHHFRRFEKILD